MGADTKIEWAHHTFNPWEGCTKVGSGCDNCYAEARNARFAHGVAGNWGAGKPRRRTSEAYWKQPLKWNRRAKIEQNAFDRFKEEYKQSNAELIKSGFIKLVRPRVFCASLADIFDNEVDPQWRHDLFDLIRATPNLDWLLLTKRIGNAARMLPGEWVGAPLANVWLGATVCNQAEADRDIPKLLAIPAVKHFLSIEPMLGPIDLSKHLLTDQHGNIVPYDGRDNSIETYIDDAASYFPTLDWVIVGGESGKKARPMHPLWVSSIRDKCVDAVIPFFFKQWGEWRPRQGCAWASALMGGDQVVPTFIVALDGTVHCFQNEQTKNGGREMLRVGKKRAGRLLDGLTWGAVPE